MKRTLLCVGAVVLSLGGPLSTAWAQQIGTPALDSMHPQIGPWPAPVGHRQPRRQDLPPGVARDEGANTPGERAIDNSLNICRC
jgi:hypothetical protein